MEIIKLKLDQLKPYEKNAKRHTDEQIQHIINSIEQFGMNDPIGIWGEKNVIIEGHGRYFALKKMGVKEVDCIRLDHLSDEERKAYTLVHNQATLETPFDDDLLKIELDGILDIDMSEFGFELNLDDNEPQEVVEDEVPEEVETRCKLGDLWQLGGHRLMCGSSFDESSLNSLISDNELDMVMTDPPYDMSMGGGGCFAGSMQHCKDRLEDIIHFDPYQLSFLPQTTAKSFYIFTSKDGIPKYLEIFKDFNFNILFWAKTNCPPFTSGTFLPDVEYMLFFAKKGKKIWNNSIKPTETYKKYYITKAKQGTEEAGTDEHPTIKPLQMIIDKIRISSNKNGFVLDLFGGSGTTLIACEQSDRKCLMMEYEPKYCDVIISRWEKFTGRKAVKLS